MAFSDFKSVVQVLQKYPLKVKQEKFLPDTQIALHPLFVENLTFALERQGFEESEIFFRESFIFPFLQEAWKRHRKLKLWLNVPLFYSNELSGEPDYLVSLWPEGVISKLVNQPLLAVMEAKKQDFEGGWAQCLAAMIACQKLNNATPVTIYGIVTTGLTWQVGKLDDNIFTRDLFSYSIATPEKVLGLLDFVFARCEEQLLPEFA